MNTQKACPKCGERKFHSESCPLFDGCAVGMECCDQPMTETQSVCETVPKCNDLCEPSHSPLPFEVITPRHGFPVIRTAEGVGIAKTDLSISGGSWVENPEMAQLNAQFITKAANEHYGLLSTVTTLEQSYAALVVKAGDLERENVEFRKVLENLLFLENDCKLDLSEFEKLHEISIERAAVLLARKETK